MELQTLMVCYKVFATRHACTVHEAVFRGRGGVSDSETLHSHVTSSGTVSKAGQTRAARFQPHT